MSNHSLIIEERARDIGGFLVGRLIPFRKKRMVGPFIFIDHMGPAEVKPPKYMDIGQHPHIGLSTLTYLLEGEMLHKDSLGTEQLITPGAVNWMTAGHGVVHTELSPEHLKDGRSYRMHGYQIWVALPKDQEEIDPSFVHVEADKLPQWEREGVHYKLVAGKGYGKESPVPVFSDLFMVELKSESEGNVDTCDDLNGEIGICVVEGYVIVGEERIEKGNMLVSKQRDSCCFTIGENSHVFLFGGEPFAEERHIYWNFVATSKEKIKAAKERWERRAFPMVEGETSYVPLPKRK
ncbi:MAG: pirin family protein [Saprospiraceae bacterium]